MAKTPKPIRKYFKKLRFYYNKKKRPFLKHYLLTKIMKTERKYLRGLESIIQVIMEHDN